MMRHAENGRDGPPHTFVPGYPAPMRIPLRKLYLARMVATCLALVAFGFVFTVYVLSEWVLGPALDPA
ncbi:MAG: hypothetical protein FWC42_11455, partial [Proteobacteria bacterium]|nr:hypothetical protein [Pseudomonadota bacterium]